MNKAVFLDRDGVLNKTIFRDGKPRAPYRIEDFELFPGVPEAISLLKEKGFLLIVVTNQPDVARGWVGRESVDQIHTKMNELISVDDVKICFHTEKDGCSCRKPMPGMLLEAAREKTIDLKKSFMVGDRYSDIAAGNSAGCMSLLIGSGDERGSHPEASEKFLSLWEAAQWIVQQK